MARFSSAVAPSRFAAPLATPGSNGYLRRQLWLTAGAYSFTVIKTGKIKLAALGAGGAGGYNKGGCGGGLSISEHAVVAGQIITVTVGAGSNGTDGSTDGPNGGSTTVVCSAASISMTANGGQGGKSGSATGGTASGGNISNFTGGASPNHTSTGGASSATPWGNGVPTQNNAPGGQGWGSANLNAGFPYKPAGGGSHSPAVNYFGGAGRIARGGKYATNSFPNSDIHGESMPWWDLTDIDGGGGGQFSDGSALFGGHGGAGAGGGGGSNSGPGGHGGFGGGGGAANSQAAGNGGNGGGGGAGGNYGGRGGDGAVIIWWDEVDA